MRNYLSAFDMTKLRRDTSEWKSFLIFLLISLRHQDHLATNPSDTLRMCRLRRFFVPNFRDLSKTHWPKGGNWRKHSNDFISTDSGILGIYRRSVKFPLFLYSVDKNLFWRICNPPEVNISIFNALISPPPLRNMSQNVASNLHKFHELSIFADAQ